VAGWSLSGHFRYREACHDPLLPLAIGSFAAAACAARLGVPLAALDFLTSEPAIHTDAESRITA